MIVILILKTSTLPHPQALHVGLGADLDVGYEEACAVLPAAPQAEPVGLARPPDEPHEPHSAAAHGGGGRGDGGRVGGEGVAAGRLQGLVDAHESSVAHVDLHLFRSEHLREEEQDDLLICAS